jgi:hypothetical protein
MPVATFTGGLVNEDKGVCSFIVDGEKEWRRIRVQENI